MQGLSLSTNGYAISLRIFLGIVACDMLYRVADNATREDNMFALGFLGTWVLIVGLNSLFGLALARIGG
jgi:hypothetical protein